MSRAAAQVLSCTVTVGPGALIGSYCFADSSGLNRNVAIAGHTTQLAFVNHLSVAGGEVRTALYASHLSLFAKSNASPLSL